jgi:hypothetical protein
MNASFDCGGLACGMYRFANPGDPTSAAGAASVAAAAAPTVLSTGSGLPEGRRLELRRASRDVCELSPLLAGPRVEISYIVDFFIGDPQSFLESGVGLVDDGDGLQ